MRWFKLLLLIPTLLGTAMASMLIAFPDAGWIDDVRWPLAAFVLLAGAWLVVSLIEHVRKEADHG